MVNRYVEGARIRAARNAKGLSQEKLGELIGANRGMVIRWEGGKHMPSPRYRQLLSEQLGIAFPEFERDQARKEMQQYLDKAAAIREFWKLEERVA